MLKRPTIEVSVSRRGMGIRSSVVRRLAEGSKNSSIPPIGSKCGCSDECLRGKDRPSEQLDPDAYGLAASGAAKMAVVVKARRLHQPAALVNVNTARGLLIRI